MILELVCDALTTVSECSDLTIDCHGSPGPRHVAVIREFVFCIRSILPNTFCVNNAIQNQARAHTRVKVPVWHLADIISVIADIFFYFILDEGR